MVHELFRNPQKFPAFSGLDGYLSDEYTIGDLDTTDICPALRVQNEELVVELIHSDGSSIWFGAVGELNPSIMSAVDWSWSYEDPAYGFEEHERLSIVEASLAGAQEIEVHPWDESPFQYMEYKEVPHGYETNREALVKQV